MKAKNFQAGDWFSQYDQEIEIIDRVEDPVGNKVGFLCEYRDRTRSWCYVDPNRDLYPLEMKSKETFNSEREADQWGYDEGFLAGSHHE